MRATATSFDLAELRAFDAEYGLPDPFFLAGVLPLAVNRGFAGNDVSPQSVVPYFAPPRHEQTADEQRDILHARLAAAGQR